MRVKITEGVCYEYVVRDVFPFAQVVGYVDLHETEVLELLDDAQHYADPASTDMEASSRRIYAKHRDRLLKVMGY